MNELAQTIAVLIRMYEGGNYKGWRMCELALLAQDKERITTQQYFEFIDAVEGQDFDPGNDQVRIHWLRERLRQRTGRCTVDFMDWYYNYIPNEAMQRY